MMINEKSEKLGFWGFLGILYVVLMSTWFKAFSGLDGRNTLLIVIMMASPLLYVLHKLQHRIYKVDLLTILMMLVMFMCAYIHTQSWRSSTFFYSCMYFFTFLLFYGIIHSGSISLKWFMKVNKWLIYSYAVMVVVQQACLIVGMEPINFTQSEAVFEDTAFRINSLSPEPSHIARFVLIFMVSYLSLRTVELQRKYNLTKDFKKDKYVWIAYFWSMLTIGSATALLYVCLAMIPMLSKKNIIYLAIAVACAIFIILSVDMRSFDRAVNIIPAAMSLDIQELFYIDASAAWRIAPLILMFKFLDPFSVNFLIGNGIDFQRSLCERFLIGYTEAAPTGGFVTMVMDYGIISFVMLLVIMFTACYDKQYRFLFWVFLIVVLPFIALNTQIFWCVLMFFSANKYYLKLNKKEI